MLGGEPTEPAECFHARLHVVDAEGACDGALAIDKGALCVDHNEDGAGAAQHAIRDRQKDEACNLGPGPTKSSRGTWASASIRSADLTRASVAIRFAKSRRTLTMSVRVMVLIAFP